MTAPPADGAPACEIVLAMAGHRITLSCACLRLAGGNGRGRTLIESRSVFPAAEVVAAWRAWHENKGVASP